MKIELECYRDYFNPDCDIENMTEEEEKEFISLKNELNKYLEDLTLNKDI